MSEAYAPDTNYEPAPDWDAAYEEFFPHQTCPASRHTRMIAEYLRDPESHIRGLLIDAGYEPDHWAQSIETTVLCLWNERAGNALNDYKWFPQPKDPHND